MLYVLCVDTGSLKRFDDNGCIPVHTDLFSKRVSVLKHSRGTEVLSQSGSAFRVEIVFGIVCVER